jgi:uncharacterized protein YycO
MSYPIKNLQMSMNQHYAELLDRLDWDLFCTFTTERPLKRSSARFHMTKLCKILKVPVRAGIFWITEAFKSGEGHHIHALIKTKVPGTVIKSWWENRHGRCTVDEFDKNRGGADYVTKYLDQGQNDFDIIPQEQDNNQK